MTVTATAENTSEFDSPDEKLFRMIHPSWVDQGNVMSIAFKPTPKDEGKLSTFRNSKISVEESFNNYTANGSQCEGVQANVVEEVNACEGLKLIDDEDDHGKAHTSIDFNSLSNSKKDKTAKKLRDFAKKRGWAHLPNLT